ncbi:uncharacterized protein LOC105694698 [Orussus abietinus]|uniref:uncharacterized protein LOC105694698 n=1 Tax=Orussus abietinus TaxID=222816 RepID=UPI000626DA75|nr:uncharacterized protein LOC105694698 [Orussus abietinus]
MVVGGASIHNIMGGMESTGTVRLHNHKRKLKQRFDIIKKLGQGTYGKVQLGINKETGQEVAIKTIKKCKVETEADLVRIRREIQIMSSVQHPNIIHIYEVFENKEKMVLVMEYAAGGELYDYLRKRKVLSEKEARRIFRQIAIAVYYCHKHKICHRDLKLENILLDQVGNAKIADFGLSNVFDEQRLLDTFCGSPLYASPEIVKGTPYHGPEVDCWSLGVLLYTLVYGAMPFDGSNFKRLVKQISQSDYFEPQKPSPASPLIKDMLTVCPKKRSDIEKICTHWWVNEGYEINCFDIAEELAAETPVRLDLLLSLVPQAASADKLVVGDQQAGGDVANNMSSETLVPTRCHSVGSLMELDRNNSDRRIREMVEEEPRMGATGDAKRKLETTPSMDEAVASEVKRKERVRRIERMTECEPRSYRSGSRHHSAPIPNPITEEAMEVCPPAFEIDPIAPTVTAQELDKTCLELIQESGETGNRERSKTPVAAEGHEVKDEYLEQSVGETKEHDARVENQNSEERASKSPKKDMSDKPHKSPDRKKPAKEKVGETVERENNAVSQEPSSRSTEAETKTSDANSETPAPKESNKSESVGRTNIKKLREKALSLDSELLNEPAEPPVKPTERRRSKIFETAEKFNQMALTTEMEKPKKIFIPGVNVGGAKRAFERKASLSSIATPPSVKPTKAIIDVPTDKKNDKPEEKSLEAAKTETETKDDRTSKRDEEKKRAVDIITGALGKPPMQRKVNGSPPTSPQSNEAKKLGLKVQVGPNDVRTATVTVSTPVETKFPFETKPSVPKAVSSTPDSENSPVEEPRKSSKMEITLKSATLPRPRKTSKAEIILTGAKSPESFKSEVEAKIAAVPPQKLRTQRSEIAFPVAAAVPQAHRCSSLEPEDKSSPKERIIPIHVEPGSQQPQHSSTPPPKPPMPQRSMSQRSNSLSRQSTADSDTDSALGSTSGPEPIRKSPREYIIPIAVEGGGYVTPRSGSVEPESKTSAPTSTTASRPRFGRPRRMSSLLSDASEDESPFSTLHRDSDDLLQRHMHRLRSSRPTRQPPEHADSLSSGEDDDDDGFELLTAENLFSTLLSRVRSLTQRLNVDDNRGSGFLGSRLLGRLGSNSPQGFWGVHEPLSRRISESQFRRSLSRDTDRFGCKDPSDPGSPGAQNNQGTRSTPSRENVFETGSNTLPRDKSRKDEEAECTEMRRQAQESLEQSFTPSLARRLSRQFIEQTRHSLPRSPSIPREKYQPPTQRVLGTLEVDEADKRPMPSTSSDQTEYRGRSVDRVVRRTSSLLEPKDAETSDRKSPRRSISLFDDEDKLLLPPLPRQVANFGRKLRDAGKSTGGASSRRENFHVYRNENIQEETDDSQLPRLRNRLENKCVENGSASEGNSTVDCNSVANLIDPASSASARSSETSITESSSNLMDYSGSYKSEDAKDFENRLLAAENLIKESKKRNLGGGRFDPNLRSSYKDIDKCDKDSLGSIVDVGTIATKRRSCIPSLRLRSGSLNRETSLGKDRRKSYAGSQSGLCIREVTPERSILSKFFKPGGSKDEEPKDAAQKPKAQRRISRFLRPDFFDTPREESQYVKEKEARKAAENERRKSRFTRKKVEPKDEEKDPEGAASKELKNEVNSITKERSDALGKDEIIEKDAQEKTQDETKCKIDKQNSKSGFLYSLEKKLEKFRSGDDNSKTEKLRNSRENSAPPAECLPPSLEIMKKTLSVENLATGGAAITADEQSSSSKSKVSSVLGLFKNNDGKSSSNGARPQSAILSRLRKSPYKGSRSDTVLTGDASANSKIPTKQSRAAKKVSEVKKSPEKVTETKRTPTREKLKDKITPERTTADTKRSSVERTTKENKKITPDKVIQSKLEGQEKSDVAVNGLPVKDGVAEKTAKKAGSSERVIDKVSSSTEKGALMKKISPDKDNKQAEIKTRKISPDKDNKQSDDKSSDSEERKVSKLKRNSSSSVTSSRRNGSMTKVEKGEEVEKKVVKATKTKDPVEKDGEKPEKKKSVRVVKKVAKKSPDSSDSKSEGKEGKEKKSLIKTMISESKSDSKEGKEGKEKKSFIKKIVSTRKEKNPEASAALSNDRDAKEPSLPKAENPRGTINENTVDSTTPGVKPSRSNLKLDLTRIPQHSFRGSSAKKEPPKTEGKSSDDAKMDGVLSKITHHANITGNKIIIDKPLSAKDVAELKNEVRNSHENLEVEVKEEKKEPEVPQVKVQITEPEVPPTIAETSPSEKYSPDPPSLKESPNENTEEILTPVDDTDNFDFWSVCSADMNHLRGDLHSPTSPTYSLALRGDYSTESIVDRIRRRSFYSRFNDRKRKTSLIGTSSSLAPATSSTLPRKFSYGSSRDRDLPLSWSSRRNPERTYSLYNDDIVAPSRVKSPVDRYSEVGSTYSIDSRPTSDSHHGSLSSSYDPLRRYSRSPTLMDSTSSRKMYRSADFTDSELGSYKTPLTGSFSSDGNSDPYTTRSTGTLPKRYGSTVSSLQPKTPEYYEELLSPGTSEYFSSRKPLTSGEVSARFENGYHNGNLDLPQLGDKWKSYSDKVTEIDIGDDSERRERTRSKSQQRVGEPRDLPSPSLEPRANVSTAE